jgi:hypothetical protein
MPLLLLSLVALTGCAHNPTPRCAAASDCANGNTCYRGFCIAAGAVDTGPAPDAGACGFGQTRCGHDCVYLQTDRDHCGTCETRCHGGGMDRCSFGHCGP